ncbi:MAG: beta-ketoacyl-[acyl-carrier-protein] synthase family protein [Planctomycetes bacterium]|nr:beta-ketoacyl-[acyl-carrier-protein] synthase family protein [Planctomycetota bacterium]
MINSGTIDSRQTSRRVVVTGIGWVTPLGNNIETVWKRLLAGESGVEKTTHFDASTFPSQFSAQVKDFDFPGLLGEEHATRHATASLNSRFALVAALQAWNSAGMKSCPATDASRIGLYLGGGEGPLDFESVAAAAIGGWEDEDGGKYNAVKWAHVARERLGHMSELEQDPNLPASHVAVLLGIEGPSFNTLTACAASTQAIGEATCIIRRGDADVMVSGGAHSMIHPLGVTGFNRLTALSTRNDSVQSASRPFDRTRDGFVLGEGAAIVILEELEHARSRGATVLSEVVGYGSTADAFRITDIHENGRGAVAAMRLAIEDAGLQPSDIGYINAHGTSTEENDKIETLAIRTLFGSAGSAPPVSSIKSMMGHLIAAAGATELITCVLALRDGIIPPTMNYANPDPNCDLDYVPNEARKADIKYALSNSFGFGGQNDTLVIRKFDA